MTGLVKFGQAKEHLLLWWALSLRVHHHAGFLIEATPYYPGIDSAPGDVALSLGTANSVICGATRFGAVRP